MVKIIFLFGFGEENTNEKVHVVTLIQYFNGSCQLMLTVNIFEQ